MKILHIGQMIGGLDIYIRNSIIYNNVEDNEYVIVCGKDDKHQPVIRNGIEVVSVRILGHYEFGTLKNS